MLTRREVLEHLVTVWGIRESARLRRLTREFLAYRARWHYPLLRSAPLRARA
ncbi:MAG: hypothetical protein HGA98_02075 [Deltaproteobacteria bacterium]|nr:hypothetical protein [Deltaproteobacteria bacterium]